MDSLKYSLLAVAMASTAFIVMPQSIAAGPDVKPMASCGSPTTSTFPGGYVVKRSCDGSTLSGIGTILDDAVTNVNGFMAVFDRGLRCNYSSIDPSPGTFDASFSCSKRDGSSGPYAFRISGIGTKATDAGINALGFAQLYVVSNGYRCSSSEFHSLVGGFITDFSCQSPSTSGGYAGRLSGIGSTSTDAAQNALGFAELAASIDQRCSTSESSVKINGSAFEVRFSCTGRTVTGYGSTLTSAGRDALLQAQSL